RVIEQSIMVAAELRHNHIGSSHVLLGILRDDDNDDNEAKSVLLRVGADPDVLQSAMTASIPMSHRSRVNLLLISNSTMHGGGYLQHCAAEIKDFLGERKRVMFVPFALADHDGYAQKARESFAAMGHDIDSVHTHANPVAAIDGADAVFIGGGNTFRLLAALAHHDLISAIQRRVLTGMPYIGSSAGTNVATQSIRTTNDMPIVQPPSFTALQLVPFQINPHYLDPDPSSAHMGETRAERIQQFHEEHEMPVLGLREGCMLRVNGATMLLRGTTNARLFRRAQEPEEFQPPCDISFLLED
ncbi:MAG: dipeptidase E, partial [Planctomycetota bacterium]